MATIKIVVAEDDAATAENIKALLLAKGYKVFTAKDGTEAVETCRREKPDVLLLDILMPKMGGFDVCRILKSEAPTQAIKVIMITALGRMGDVETAFQHGAVDYIIKPFDPDRLFKKLEKVLGGP